MLDPHETSRFINPGTLELMTFYWDSMMEVSLLGATDKFHQLMEVAGHLLNEFYSDAQSQIYTRHFIIIDKGKKL